MAMLVGSIKQSASGIGGLHRSQDYEEAEKASKDLIEGGLKVATIGLAALFVYAVGRRNSFCKVAISLGIFSFLPRATAEALGSIACFCGCAALRKAIVEAKGKLNRINLIWGPLFEALGEAYQRVAEIPPIFEKSCDKFSIRISFIKHTL